MTELGPNLCCKLLAVICPSLFCKLLVVLVLRVAGGNLPVLDVQTSEKDLVKFVRQAVGG